MFEKIKELIVESLGIEEDQVTMEASFKEDLKVDSLDLFEMVMSLEDEFRNPYRRVREDGNCWRRCRVHQRT